MSWVGGGELEVPRSLAFISAGGGAMVVPLWSQGVLEEYHVLTDRPGT